MYIREATLADTNRLGELAAAAFHEDPLMTAIEPRRRQFPEDYLRGWVYSMQAKIVAPEVAVVVSTDGSAGVVTGFGTWRREGDGDIAKQWRKRRGGGGVLESIEAMIVSWERALRSYLEHPSRSDDPAAYAAFRTGMRRDQSPIWSVPGRRERWHLCTLAVDPAFQRRGFGGLLVRWGMERARREGVAVGLEAGPTRAGFYEKLGFREIGKVAPFAGSDGPFEGLTAPVMMWEPGER